MNKLKSRKFQVWIVWLIIALISLFKTDLPKETIFQYFGLISIVYIGSNVAQDWIFNKLPKNNIQSQ
jgi:hypothetical protein